MTRASHALDHLPSTRRDLLRLIKANGEAGADDLARELHITPSGTRQHLAALEQSGLIEARDHRDGPGRPKRRYRLTAHADALFPRSYAELTTELLGYVAHEDPDLLARIFDRRAERRLTQTLTRTAHLALPEQIRELARILDEDGYLASFEAHDDGTYTLTENNCAVLNVALRFNHACGSELQYLQAALPDARITRIAHMLSGAHVCAYRIEPRAR